MVVSIITNSFLEYTLVDFPEVVHVDTCDNFSCQLTEACCVLYKVQSDDKCENELKDWCRDADHVFPGQ